MTETKANISLGVSVAAIIVAASSIVHTNNQIAVLTERMQTLEDDVTTIALNLREEKNMRSDENSRVQNKLRKITKRLSKLDKKLEKGSDLQIGIENIKKDILTVFSHLEIESQVLVNEPVSKPVKKKERESEEDSTDLDDYLASLTKLNK